jgi:hypothetical protein
VPQFLGISMNFIQDLMHEKIHYNFSSETKEKMLEIFEHSEKRPDLLYRKLSVGSIIIEKFFHLLDTEKQFQILSDMMKCNFKINEH